jgi:citrate lyase subunit beta/citryl-CoA lyase
MARSLCIMGARAAGVYPLDTIQPNFRDAEALVAEVRNSRRDGFAGKFAIHPDQVEAINAGFRPDEKEIAKARAIVAAFKSSDGVGTIQIDGQMVDKPHLTQALQILAAAGEDVSA